MLTQFGPNIWIAQQAQRYLGVELATRMTAIRIADCLFVHSPIRPTPDLRAELDAIAPVAFVVAPNRFHHLYVPEFCRIWPDARLFCAPGLEKKRPGLPPHTNLDDRSEAGWAEHIDQIFFRAFPPLNEVQFFHRQSHTLIVSDLLFNIRRVDSWWSKVALALDGGLDVPAVPRSFKLYLRFRKAECRALVDRILQWDFDRIVMAHGAPIATDARCAFEHAWSFV
jgi:hypothetical protein